MATRGDYDGSPYARMGDGGVGDEAMAHAATVRSIMMVPPASWSRNSLVEVRARTNTMAFICDIRHIFLLGLCRMK